jgi:predicted MFS family arabinose efflux permease
MSPTEGEACAPSAPNPVLRVLLPFAGAYFLSYLFRSVNAVIGPDLARDFGLSPAQLGLLTSAYFLAFAAFQLPLGLLLDRFGPRRTDAALLLIAACGALLFALAPAFAPLVGARALIGLGVSGCLMSAIKANTIWFPLSRLSRVNGWMFFTGGVGMIAATVPVEAALVHVSWRVVFAVLAVATVCAAMLIFFVVPERARGSVRQPLPDQLRGLRQVFAHRRFWDIALAAAASQASSMALMSLWSGPWLRDVAGLDREAAARALLLMAFSTTAGFLFWGNFTARIARRGVSPITVFAAGMGAFLLFQMLITLGGGRAATLCWMGFGFFGTAGSLSYAILPHYFPLALAGRVNTALNSLVFASAFVVQWAVGVLIDRWPTTAVGYDPRGYLSGFGLFLAIQFSAWIWMLVRARRDVPRPPL